MQVSRSLERTLRGEGSREDCFCQLMYRRVSRRLVPTCESRQLRRACDSDASELRAIGCSRKKRSAGCSELRRPYSFPAEKRSLPGSERVFSRNDPGVKASRPFSESGERHQLWKNVFEKRGCHR